MRWAVPVALASASCQIALNLHHLDPVDAGADVPGDGSCVFGAWSTPTRISANSTIVDDDNPALSPDGKLIVFERRPTNGSPDLYYAARSGNDFVDPAPLPSNDTTLPDTGAFWSPDGTTLYFTQGATKKSMQVSAGAFGTWGTTQEFDSITSYFERPRFSSDGLELVYFNGAPADLVHAIRGAASGTLWTESPLTSLNSPYVDSHPTLTADDLTIYFSSTNTGSGATPVHHLFEAHRSAKQGQFDMPTDLGDFGVAQPYGPDISRDGTTFVFTGYSGSQADTFIMTRSCQ